MDGFEDLYFALFNAIDDVVNEFQGNPIYEPVVQKLIQVELMAEDMYVNRPRDEDEVTEEEDEM